MSRFINPVPQYKPNSKLFFFKSGTNTQLITYKDQFQSPDLANTHPVLTDALGNVPNIFFNGTAKLIILDENDVQYIERDPVGGEAELGDFTLWDTSVTYDLNDITEGSDGAFYQSLSNGNQANDPVTSPAEWKEIRFIEVWNTNVAYVSGVIVQTSDGNLWKSLGSNISIDPSSDDGSNWLPAVDVAGVIDDINTVVPQTGSGELTALRTNQLRDDGSYTLPAANTVLANQTITITQPDLYKANEPSVSVFAGDIISDSTGGGSPINFSNNSSIKITLTSDGVSTWSL